MHVSILQLLIIGMEIYRVQVTLVEILKNWVFIFKSNIISLLIFLTILFNTCDLNCRIILTDVKSGNLSQFKSLAGYKSAAAWFDIVAGEICLSSYIKEHKKNKPKIDSHTANPTLSSPLKNQSIVLRVFPAGTQLALGLC